MRMDWYRIASSFLSRYVAIDDLLGGLGDFSLSFSSSSIDHNMPLVLFSEKQKQISISIGLYTCRLGT